MLQTVMENWDLFIGNSTSRYAHMNTQIPQTVSSTLAQRGEGAQIRAQIAHTVMGNGGLYHGNNTNRRAQMNAQMAQTVMENGLLYNGNNTNSRHNQRIRKIFQRLLSTTGTREGIATTADALEHVRKTRRV